MENEKKKKVENDLHNSAPRNAEVSFKIQIWH